MDKIIQESMFDDRRVLYYDHTSELELASFLEDTKGETICFTGHRPNHLPWGNNEDCLLAKSFIKKLDSLISALINAGFLTFIDGMAEGFDIIAAERVLAARKHNKTINLSLVIPFLGQEEKFGSDWKARYNFVCESADNMVCLSNSYFTGCYHKRNQFMVDKADIVIACFDNVKGGTASTVDYAIKSGKKVIVLRP